MGATARSGVYLCCVANYDSARVEIFIDQGDYQKNRAIYNHLEQNRDAIEAAYGKSNGSLYSCFSEEFAGEMRKLCEMADIITPNRTEARLLLGNAGTDENISSEALLEGLRNRNVIITSVRRGDKIGYLARLGDEIVRIEKPMVHRQLHGTGDVFTSALCGEILSGSSLKTALLHAADFCDRSIQDTAKYRPAHWYGLCFEEELKKYRR